jgi:hypothetical protein
VGCMRRGKAQPFALKKFILCHSMRDKECGGEALIRWLGKVLQRLSELLSVLNLARYMPE